MVKKERTEKLLSEKRDEINELIGKGYMTSREGQKVIRMCNKLERELDDPNFDYMTIPLNYSELFLNHRFLHDPSNTEFLLQMAIDLKIK